MWRGAAACEHKSGGAASGGRGAPVRPSFLRKQPESLGRMITGPWERWRTHGGRSVQDPCHRSVGHSLPGGKCGGTRQHVARAPSASHFRFVGVHPEDTRGRGHEARTGRPVLVLQPCVRGGNWKPFLVCERGCLNFVEYLGHARNGPCAHRRAGSPAGDDRDQPARHGESGKQQVAGHCTVRPYFYI